VPQEARSPAELQERLGICFQHLDALEMALTHRSLLAEQEGVTSNERLEFLGDAVLGIIIAEECYRRFPTWSEGELSKAKATVVDERALAEIARRWELGTYSRVSRGEDASGGRERRSLLADMVEAVVGAYFLDSGLDACRTFVLRECASALDAVTSREFDNDYKTQLQEVYQARYQAAPTYIVIAEDGPPHDRTFTVAVVFTEDELGRGEGKSKKVAEQQAAANALRTLRAQQD